MNTDEFSIMQLLNDKINEHEKFIHAYRALLSTNRYKIIVNILNGLYNINICSKKIIVDILNGLCNSAI